MSCRNFYTHKKLLFDLQWEIKYPLVTNFTSCDVTIAMIHQDNTLLYSEDIVNSVNPGHYSGAARSTHAYRIGAGKVFNSSRIMLDLERVPVFVDRIQVYVNAYKIGRAHV